LEGAGGRRRGSGNERGTERGVVPLRFRRSSQTDPMPIRRKRVLTDIARLSSTVCNPFLTAFALLVLMTHEIAPTTTAFWLLLFSSTFFTSIGPMFFVLKMYLDGRITDLDMSIRSEREAVFGTFVIFYILGTITMALIHAPTILIATMAGYTTSALVVQVITRSWKISTHAVGITASIVVLLFLYKLQPLPFVVLIPLVGWSRIYLKAHTFLQVLAGTALGVVSVLLFFYLFHIIT
jgi:membrane-associated phospholipid phosphatase